RYAGRPPDRNPELVRSGRVGVEGDGLLPKKGLSRTSGDQARFPGFLCCSATSQAACRTLARSSRKPARPYLDRLLSFRRFTCPSTGPLLPGGVPAACTA